MNNADLVVALLKAAGVARGFGVPSGNVLPLMEAMRSGGIDFVLTAHEGSAGFAADVTSRLTGVPGFCIATLGPGATNLATGVGCAWLDRSPLIAITCTLNEAQLGRRIQMWIDHQALFKPITKGSLMLRSGSIAVTIAEALRLALTEPRGPVHLDLPEDVALAAVTEPIAGSAAIAPDERSLGGGLAPTLPLPSFQPFSRGEKGPVPLPPGEGSRVRGAAFTEAVGILRKARRPLAIIGASAMRMSNPALLRDFVERHGIPFASTTMAKGLIDEVHPLSIGCIERACRQLQRQFIREHADLVIGIGYDTIEVEYEAWVGTLPVLHVDRECADADRSVTLAHQLVGDLDASVAALAALEPCANAWNARAIEQHRARFQAALRPATEGFSPHAAIDVVRRVLPRAGVLAFDVGAHTHQIASQWTAHTPRTFLITNGWSSMGFGLPAAIAAKLAHRDLPVVCIVGDGCFQMTCGELAVAKRERLAIPFVVLDDRWLSLIKVKQERRGLEHYGTALFGEAYQAPPAHYFGVRTVGVRSAAELERALAAALNADEATVIEALVDAASYSETVFD
jgi:acetolactate synthase-1/2/3 large subunit